ncbi:23S rRNA (guanosine(2251)-2'-O)-methyltransferase RlmB [Peptoniphilus sp. KCTC 25270]|uniref:23S rRNA (guanosine(2251)-2'-O)-methyltransferase RlmB n=1 Tax=Peptoniphilus sp. KCTC 25270 TaxID=2897414 RepID=UPI001E6121EA|nr:23S rRNA (guanosine(2251)-2'-O)-methyltransferase RlmB [Peptoniphilus sp. KCTC 25270]MCD1147606.1 23S rRNA (guanosine(2251)-2'-O)-methyltransferase RlmB [Peptoniphilus sp. KCTC 25270]
MKSQMIFGRNPVLEALGENMDRIYVQRGLKEGTAKKIRGRAKDLGVEVIERDKSRLDEMCDYQNHQGFVAYVTDFVYSTIDDMLAEAKEKGEDPLIVLLDGITDPHNLGAIIRSSLALGAHGVVIPKNRSASVNGTVFKTSAGAVDHMKVAKVTNLGRAVEELKEKGIWTYGCDLGGETLYDTNLTGPVAIVIGAEGKGLSKKIGEKVDIKITIPMEREFDSLNASVAASVVLYEISRQNHGKKKKTL